MIDKNAVLKFILYPFLSIAYWLDAYAQKEVFLVPINLIALMFVLVYVHQDILKSSSIVMYEKYNS